MQILEPPPLEAELDELARWQLAIARRADELMRRDLGRHPGRNYWLEAEQEVWARYLPSRAPAEVRENRFQQNRHDNSLE